MTRSAMPSGLEALHIATFDATTNGIEYDVLVLRCTDTAPSPRGT